MLEQHFVATSVLPTELVHTAAAAVRVVCISDTHGEHRQLQVPDGDLLIHAGDITEHGESEQIEDFERWMGELPHPHKIVIAGNHDTILDKSWAGSMGKAVVAESRRTRLMMERSPHFIYSEGGAFEVLGLKIYASPWTPKPAGGHGKTWAFGGKRTAAHAEWGKIPTDTQLLVTHGPPLGLNDRPSGETTSAGPASWGCEPVVGCHSAGEAYVPCVWTHP